MLDLRDLPAQGELFTIELPPSTLDFDFTSSNLARKR